jgi:uncharacterized membrane protein required for colicin V production
MIAAATQATHSMALDKLPFGWFDFALVAVLAFGLFRGRKNGMTKEVLPMFQWVATVLVCGLGYGMVGQVVFNISGWSRLVCYLLGYFSLMFVVYLLFILVKKIFMPRLTGSNFFGSSEYYLGMAAGVIRYACLLFVALALLNAPYYTAADIQQQKDFDRKTYGAGLKDFNGSFFEAFYPAQIQVSVFQKSFTGKLIKDYADVMLVNSVTGDAIKPAAQKKPVSYMGN